MRNLNFFEKNNSFCTNVNILKIYNLLNVQNFKLVELQKFIYFPSLFQSFNDDTDKKKIEFPVYKLNSLKFEKNEYANIESFFKTLVQHDNVNFSKVSNLLFKNENLS